MESSSAKVGDLTKAFFYGTLKQNEPNEQHLEHQNCQFICEAITVEKWPLTIGTDFNIPLMLNKKGFGNVSIYFTYIQNSFLTNYKIIQYAN